MGIVGSRKPTDYGLQAAADIGEALARSGALIVSGLADGLDSAGHRAAVKNGCPTIGILGVPIDRTYPAANGPCGIPSSRTAASSANTHPASPRRGRWAFCSATGSSRRCRRRCWWWKPARKKRHHVHRVPRGAVRQAGVCGAGQHLFPGFGRDQPPAARGRARGPAAAADLVRRWACRRVPRRKQRSASRTP